MAGSGRSGQILGGVALQREWTCRRTWWQEGGVDIDVRAPMWAFRAGLGLLGEMRSVGLRTALQKRRVQLANPSRAVRDLD